MAVFLVAVGNACWGWKGKAWPKCKNNRKYDMGKSQLSGFWALKTTSQTSEGIPWKLWLVFALKQGLLLIRSFFLSSQWTQKGFPGQLKRKIKILCPLSGQWLPVISANSKVERKRNFHVCKQLHLQVGAKLGWSGHLSSFMTGWLTEKPPQSLKLLNWWITSAKICQISVFMNFMCLGMRVLKWIF